MGFRKLETSIPDLFIIQPDIFGDDRGFFMELFNHNSFSHIGLGHLNFVQDNLSSSVKGTLRGMHFQKPPAAQGKLVVALQGSVLDMVVDLRKNSPTFGQHYAKILDSTTKTMMYVPEGFAHGFQVLSDTCLFFYKCTSLYQKDSEGGIAWDDPDLQLPWANIPPVISEKDKQHLPFARFDSPF
ncbi:MAG: dTDP-4-dehydrorhamnose 3,5-epimerase [Bacteroidia bacterium]|nr:dTDP-4-dehydrorhamnose 3,5-epimerase [Bacteroidia bacterium]